LCQCQCQRESRPATNRGRGRAGEKSQKWNGDNSIYHNSKLVGEENEGSDISSGGRGKVVVVVVLTDLQFTGEQDCSFSL